MYKMFSPLYLILLMLFAFLTACSSLSTKRDNINVVVATTPSIKESNKSNVSYSGVFPKPSKLEPAVDFWRKTYAVWSRSQVAIHDDRYLDIIYDVMIIPGDVGEGLTQDQKELNSKRKEYWKALLAGLETKLRYGADLSNTDKQIIAQITNLGKPISVINGASDRLRSQRGTRERFKRGLEISGRYDRQFRKIFREAGLPEDFAYLPHVESSFQTSAKSSAGALGVWQFTKGAAKTFMPGNDSVDKRLDPIASANGAARYLNYAYTKLHDWPTAVTSYNHGVGGMKRAQNQIGTDFTRIVEEYDGPAFGFASRNYYAQFLAAREIASAPHLYYSEGINYDYPDRDEQLLAEK